jgi:phospholipid-binding lipoprotein MlaA
MAKIRKTGAVLFASSVLAGCATSEAGRLENDPLEPTNRALFEATLRVDRTITLPVATAYRNVVPEGGRDMIRNFLNNLGSPSIFANDVLQGETERAGITLARVIVNTGVGVGGLFDVATEWGMPRHSEDFGQTLAVWGVGEGPYLVIPILGPSNPRDLVGRGVDFFFDPLSYVEWGDHWYVPYTRFAADQIDLRARNIETIENLEATSADFYAAARSLYRQNRQSEINNGVTTIEELPDF